MSWEAIGAIAELVGAIAVVASLMYLAQQLKMTRQVDQVSALQAVFDGFTHHAGQLFSAPNDLALRGLADRGSLTESERLRFDQLLENVLNQGEMTGALIHAGLMTAGELGPLDWWLQRKIFRYPGARDWLEEFAPAYPPDYLARLQRAADDAEASTSETMSRG